MPSSEAEQATEVQTKHLAAEQEAAVLPKQPEELRLAVLSLREGQGLPGEQSLPGEQRSPGEQQEEQTEQRQRYQ